MRWPWSRPPATRDEELAQETMHALNAHIADDKAALGASLNKIADGGIGAIFASLCGWAAVGVFGSGPKKVGDWAVAFVNLETGEVGADAVEDPDALWLGRFLVAAKNEDRGIQHALFMDLTRNADEKSLARVTIWLLDLAATRVKEAAA